MTLTKPKGPHQFDTLPQLVCLDCGKAVFGRIIKSFDVFENAECDICAALGQVVHAKVFRDS